MMIKKLALGGYLNLVIPQSIILLYGLLDTFHTSSATINANFKISKNNMLFVMKILIQIDIFILKI